jgi:hypothetical protein
MPYRNGASAGWKAYQILCVLWLILLVACNAQTLASRPTTAPTPTDASPAAATPVVVDVASAEETLPANVLPSAADFPPGWQPDGDAKRYDSETLFDFMNGAADLYFTYGFESLTVGQYIDNEGRSLQVEVYGTASDADAYGLFTYNSYGEPLDLGLDGELDSGYRLAFWQGRHYVQIASREAVEDDVLLVFGQAVALALPQGGQRPSLIDGLPQEGLVPGSVRFFREKMALDNLLWLGSDDVLGLGADTGGVVARYERDGQALDLLLVSFPDAQRAEQARAGLESASLDNLRAVGVSGRMVAVLFGSASPTEETQALLDQALAAGRR